LLSAPHHCCMLANLASDGRRFSTLTPHTTVCPSPRTTQVAVRQWLHHQAEMTGGSVTQRPRTESCPRKCVRVSCAFEKLRGCAVSKSAQCKLANTSPHLSIPTLILFMASPAIKGNALAISGCEWRRACVHQWLHARPQTSRHHNRRGQESKP
jgi:hypothetical protein